MCIRDRYRQTTITTSTSAAGATTIALAREGSYAGARAYDVTLHAFGRVRAVRADGRTRPTRYDASARTTTFVVPATARRIAITP